MRRMKHSTPIGIVFKQNNITYQVVGASVDLNNVFRKDADEKGKPYYKLRAMFICESCGDLAERQILHIYEKILKDIKPYIICDACLHQLSAEMNKLVAKKKMGEIRYYATIR